MCFLMYSYELHQETVKKSQKNAALAFYHAFYDQNWVKIRENPLFSLKSRYLRNTFFETSLARKELQQFSNYWVVGLLGCWTIGTLSDNWHSGKWDSIPPFGHSLPIFTQNLFRGVTHKKVMFKDYKNLQNNKCVEIWTNDIYTNTFIMYKSNKGGFH